jgi:uncharacterized SAM-binding protein YcdF (DUF218 family)
MLRDSYIHPLFNGLIVLLLLWLAGLFIFAADVAAQNPGLGVVVRKVDGIVVLTGGTERVPAGLDLLAAGIAPRLMISGVDPRADTAAMIPEAHPAKNKRSCCITFGTYAEDTIGNARETAAWADRYAIKSLIVVTSNYHIRRAMIEFRQALPDVILIPYVVAADHVRTENWWNYPGTASLMLGEYSKYLLALVKGGLHAIFRE